MKRAFAVFTIVGLMMAAGPAEAAQRGNGGGNGKGQARGTSGTLSATQLKLQRNTNLANKLDDRLPPGVNVVEAAAGFRNLGQFVAAVNVSNNLGIPFSQLRDRMVNGGSSLGQAIQQLRPSADYNNEVRRAERDADIFVRGYDRDGHPGKDKGPKSKSKKKGPGR